ncbi:putative penicillin-insensitive murein endopeptidase [Yersinia pestis biovar Microtus str. 91001]|nr:murein DD-endopeptidase [Yersinia pestis KIM10+]AAS62616.1 putative penicillin-insensitive murein endopeptidase [Yersinia pestis biovar Microtus str. 91001]
MRRCGFRRSALVDSMKNWIVGMVALVTMVPVMAATPWQKITHPVAGSPQSIGGFANGCVIGAQPLPLESADYQVMRSDQRRYFGHPDLLNFIHRLSAQAHQQQLGTVLIGDMAMPAGGRFSSGHASHQSGLDVDIWLQLPKQRWSQQQLLKPQPIDLVAVDGKRVIPALWQPQIESLIKLAAKDNDVTRIFVNPAIKKQLCLDAGADRQWLHKVRPWFAHRAHMHVRLRCPANSLECVDQDTPPPGDGCGAELESWFQPPPPSAKPGKTLPPPLPPSCQALLDNHFATE